MATGGTVASEVFRNQAITENVSGLISTGGGELTLFRLMAQEVVDLVFKRIKDFLLFH